MTGLECAMLSSLYVSNQSLHNTIFCASFAMLGSRCRIFPPSTNEITKDENKQNDNEIEKKMNNEINNKNQLIPPICQLRFDRLFYICTADRLKLNINKHKSFEIVFNCGIGIEFSVLLIYYILVSFIQSQWKNTISLNLFKGHIIDLDFIYCVGLMFRRCST